MKADDVLYKIAGAMVPGSVKEFSVFVNNLKTETPLEVVVMRDGQVQTAGRLTLPKDTETRWRLSQPEVKKTGPAKRGEVIRGTLKETNPPQDRGRIGLSGRRRR